MPLPAPRPRPAALLASTALLLALAVPGVTTTAAAAPNTPAPAAPAAPVGLSTVTLAVPSVYDAAPFDQPRSVQVPEGWTASVWARRTAPRLMALAPDGTMLVSRPAYGRVTRLTPHASGVATSRSLVIGLRKPHGLAFDGSTLYVAESNQIDAYDYADGELSNRRVVIRGLPDAESDELGGTYAHALKSIAVGPDHALYISVEPTEM